MAKCDADLVERSREIVVARRQREQIVEPIRLEEAIASGAEWNENLIVGAAEARARSLGLQNPDDLKLNAPDSHRLSHDGVRILDAKHRKYARAEHGDALPADVLGRREEPAAIDHEMLNQREIRGCADDLDVCVAVTPKQLEILVLLRFDGKDVRRALLDRLRIIRGDAFPNIRLDATNAHPLRVDLERGCAQLVDAVLHGLLGA